VDETDNLHEFQNLQQANGAVSWCVSILSALTGSSIWKNIVPGPTAPEKCSPGRSLRSSSPCSESHPSFSLEDVIWLDIPLLESLQSRHPFRHPWTSTCSDSCTSQTSGAIPTTAPGTPIFAQFGIAPQVCLEEAAPFLASSPLLARCKFRTAVSFGICR
jgi:hypothetical protein